jgi:hypothetical protein
MKELNAALRWVERELGNLAYGEIGLSIVVHNGTIKRIEKTLTQKEQVEGDK